MLRAWCSVLVLRARRAVLRCPARTARLLPLAGRDLKFRDQIFDSARSGPRNIAEGFARYHHPEFAHLLGVAKASIA